MRILIIYAQTVFWSMGEGCGATSFTMLPSRLAGRGHEVRVSLPNADRPEAAAGATGAAGKHRATGAMGEAGPNGAAGTNGATGAAGAAGAVGATGAAGAAGATETTEATEATGTNGSFAPEHEAPRRGRQTLPPAEPYRGFLLHRHRASRSYVPNANVPLPARLAGRLECWLRFRREGYRAAAALAAAYPPDLVIGMGYYEAPVARRLARRLGVPNVTRLFGTGLSLAEGSPLRFYANFPEVAALKTPADLIITSDDGAEADRVARRLRVPPERFLHLRNGLDFDRFAPGPAPEGWRARLGLPPGRHVLLTGTRLAAEKKLERAILLLADVVRRGEDAALVLLGSGPERERLAAAATAAGVADRVLFPGPVPQAGMADWYRLADVVLSLLDRTNASNPVFEGMACGRPVFALDAGSTAEVVRHGETGVVVPRSELPRAGEELVRLLRDEERRRRLGAAGARRIRELLPTLEERWNYEAELLEAVAQHRPFARQGAGSGRSWGGGVAPAVEGPSA